MTDKKYFEKTLEVSNNTIAQAMCGPQQEHILLLEQELGVSIQERSPVFTVIGEAQGAVDTAFDILTKMSHLATTKADELDRGRVQRFVRSAQDGFSPSLVFKMKGGKAIRPRTRNQEIYLKEMEKNDIVFGLGEAGTGKTYLAVAYAVYLLEKGAVERIILTRPAVEAGENLGFLPGDLQEKIAPYLQPLFDALRDLAPDQAAVVTQQADEPSKFGPSKGGKGGQGGQGQGATQQKRTNIEVAPLAFMRGRTLSKALVILDEAQNTTSMQMKMFLTRLGEDSKMIITGDPSQIDLPGGHLSGLVDAVNVLEGTPGIGFVRFDASDVQRHPLVGKIIRAYNAASAAPAAEKKSAYEHDSGNTATPPATRKQHQSGHRVPRPR